MCQQGTAQGDVSSGDDKGCPQGLVLSNFRVGQQGLWVERKGT